MKNTAIGLFLLVGAVVRAADAGGDSQLRQTLRSTIQALNTSEADKAALQAAQADSDARIKDLTSQVQVLVKRSISDRAEAEKAAAAGAGLLADAEKSVAQLKAALDKAQAADQRGTAALADADKEKARLVSDNLALQRHLAEVKAKNASLFKIGNEILTRYEKYSLGDALKAKEPFVGLTRTKLENQVQDYEDKLLEQRVTQ